MDESTCRFNELVVYLQSVGEVAFRAFDGFGDRYYKTSVRD